MKVNNFKELETSIVSGRDKQIERIQHNIIGTRSLFQTIGDVLELYIPKFLGALISLTGGGKSDSRQFDSKYPHESN